ncbi:MAG: non-homologous end-joining DNA ligase [Actinobacteria bacterium]|nr:non-homologous end-joining DNA ligase [Actinomycetota bacterium]
MGLLDGLPAPMRERLHPEPHPDWVSPTLATLTHDRFSDPNWIYERKFDGERCLAFKNGAQVRLLSRNQLRIDTAYPEIADALAGQTVDDVVIDGEIVAAGDGQFSTLQRRMQLHDPARARASGVAVSYAIFDVVHLDGYDTRQLPLRARKSVLRRALAFGDGLHYTQHRNRDGEALFAEACERGWEGVIAKHADSTYVGRRTDQWLKFKCENRQEFVVGGYTDPAGSRVALGALLLGYYDGSDFVYAGKVGTGFGTTELHHLRELLEPLEESDPPFTHGRVRERNVHWVRPAAVVEVAFSEWTGDGRLRHPRYIGLRRDKDARQVVREG